MSAQSLIGYAILIVFGAAIFGVSGYLVSWVILPWGNHFIGSGFLVSQDSFNTAFLITQIFVASPFITLLLWGYDHLNNSNQQSGGDQ
jgi:hypothetical protein